jgi:hypothetical protein
MNKLEFNDWKKLLDCEIIEVDDSVDDDSVDDDSVAFFFKFKKGEKIKGCGEKVGFLLVDNNKPYLVKSSRIINPKLKRKGLGKFMYWTACKKLGMLSTYFLEASHEAQVLWLSMVKKKEYIVNNNDCILEITIFKNKKEKDEYMKKRKS